MSAWNAFFYNSTKLHTKCRITDIPYYGSSVFRSVVPDNFVNWSSKWLDYHPPDYTDSTIIGKPWADLDINSGTNFLWNNMDDNVNRVSHVCTYDLDLDLRPRNPMGRTGLRGRGVLGRWGPNHAADPLVTRFHKGELQFVAIKRRDSGEWAIPGGMVDFGEQVSHTLVREFSEESLGGLYHRELDDLWKHGQELYRGYVDDPRNTDNAWMETVVVNFHDATELLSDIDLHAGDDAKAVRWVSVNSNERLYASHELFINLLKKKHNLN